jgi:hypothetical protein
MAPVAPFELPAGSMRTSKKGIGRFQSMPSTPKVNSRHHGTSGTAASSNG